MSPPIDLAETVRGLEQMALEDLRKTWADHFGEPPKIRSPELLRYMIAWRWQTAALGDLSADLKRDLARAPHAGRRKTELSVGTCLRREWRGRVHEVHVTDEGFTYDGETYSSLSKIAGVIAGSKWNGRRFFGLPAA